MKSNFEFLKNVDTKLFNIIEDAEKLFRDGYFEQTMIQTRKFGEMAAKNILGVRRTTEESFDDILGTLKDILGDNQADKEFIDDLYFIKQKGNLAAHGAACEMGYEPALECLERAFEVSINYALKNGKANKKILNSHYSVDLLMTGKNQNLSEKYQEIREENLKKEKVEEKKEDKKPNKKEPKKSKKEETKKETKEKNQKNKEKPNDKTSKKEMIEYFCTVLFLIILLSFIMLFVLPV